jgi:hypothetical protein
LQKASDHSSTASSCLTRLPGSEPSVCGAQGSLGRTYCKRTLRIDLVKGVLLHGAGLDRAVHSFPRKWILQNDKEMSSDFQYVQHYDLRPRRKACASTFLPSDEKQIQNDFIAHGRQACDSLPNLRYGCYCFFYLGCLSMFRVSRQLGISYDRLHELNPPVKMRP